jgi:hypothetical protein
MTLDWRTAKRMTFGKLPSENWKKRRKPMAKQDSSGIFAVGVIILVTGMGLWHLWAAFVTAGLIVMFLAIASHGAAK